MLANVEGNVLRYLDLFYKAFDSILETEFELQVRRRALPLFFFSLSFGSLLSCALAVRSLGPCGHSAVQPQDEPGTGARPERWSGPRGRDVHHEACGASPAPPDAALVSAFFPLCHSCHACLFASLVS